MRHYLGIDIGTSGCKAVAFDRHGRLLAAAHREYDVQTEVDGTAELDSEIVIAKCLEVIAEAALAAGPGTVQALGVSSQGEAFTAIGADGEVLNRAMISSDSRAERIARKSSRHLGPQRLYHLTGHTAHPMFTLFKLLWLREAQPAIWSRARKFLCFEDLLGFRLGLPDPKISWSLAGRTMLFDVRRHRWDPALLAAVGLKPSQLARPAMSGTTSGMVAPAVSRKLHLAPGAVVVVGGHDQPCGALGAAVTAPGVAMYASGTVECISPAFSRPIFSERLRRHNLCTYDHVVPGLYTTVAFSLTGGNLLKWFRDEFGSAEVAAAARTGLSSYQLLLEQASPDPSRLLVLPYFTPSGTPYFDLETPGAILGLRLSSHRGEILRALLEGVAFEMRVNLDLLESSGCRVDELRVIGGGARSAYLNQLKADVLGKPITVLDVTEAGCLGAALLACSADTGDDVVPLSHRWVRVAGVCQPNPDHVRWYRQRFATYRRLRPALRKLHL
jgi:xylulokinase